MLEEPRLVGDTATKLRDELLAKDRVRDMADELQSRMHFTRQAHAYITQESMHLRPASQGCAGTSLMWSLCRSWYVVHACPVLGTMVTRESRSRGYSTVQLETSDNDIVNIPVMRPGRARDPRERRSFVYGHEAAQAVPA
jgi:hypothetical protein